MINWSNYFEHIFVLSRCKNFNQRKLINIEFERIGIINFNYWYNCDSILINNEHFLKHPNINDASIRATYGHYSLIKTCYELGYDNVLICEDDLCFLKDINQIYIELEKFNKNRYDIFLFDWEKIYYKSGKTQIFLLDCYYLNRKGMEYLIYCYENNSLTADCYFFDIETLRINLQYRWKFFLSTNEYSETIVDIPEEANVLPINIDICENRICIQRNNHDIYNNEIDLNNYLLE